MKTLNRTPQQIECGKRFVLGKQRRHRIVRSQVKAFHAKWALHSAAALNQPTGQQIVTAAASYLGYPYHAYGCRCEVGCPWHDCSGLVCVCMNQLGLPHICTSSFGFAQIGVDQNLVVSREYALTHPGCVAIKNPFGSPSANGANGHIVVMVGDGTDADIEEKGTAYGCVRDHNDGTRGLDFYMKLPGVNMTSLAPPGQKADTMLFFDLKHASKPNRTRSASIDAAGNIRLGNGAKLAGQTSKNVLGLHVVVPPSGGAPFMGVTHAADGGFTMQFLQKDGSFADFHYSFGL